MVGGSFGACIDLRRALTLELGYMKLSWQSFRLTLTTLKST